VDREAVAEENEVAGVDALANARLHTWAWSSSGARIITRSPSAAADAGSVTRRPWLRPWRRWPNRDAADDDVYAGVLEVVGIGRGPGAVPDDRDGLAVEQAEVSVVVIEHCPEAT